jgi:hypothetical protein
MQALSHSADGELPETFLQRLVARLRRHALWDSLLLFAPPAGALAFVLVLLSRTGYLNSRLALVCGMIILIVVCAAAWLYRRPLVPTIIGAARLLDHTAGAQDHFLTLATVESDGHSRVFLSRVRQQSASFLRRIELRRDFGYRIKRSAYWSSGASLIVVVAVNLLLPLFQERARSGTAPRELTALAREMARTPELKALAKDLAALAAQLDDPKLSAKEKQRLVQDMKTEIEEQQKAERHEQTRELLGEAAKALGGAEQQKSESGQEQSAQQQKGGGGVQSNVPQDGQGESKQSQGAGSDNSEKSGQMSQEPMDQGKAAKADSKNPGQQKSDAAGDKNDQQRPDPNQRSKDPSQAKAEKPENGMKDGAGKQRASEEPPPLGGPQADRFYKPGEGKEALARKGYVAVQLPEELIADSKGESRATKESKGGQTRSQIPVSNAPLPAHVPNAPTEKQRMPLEYRGIIR